MPVANEESTMGQILDEILELPYDRLYVYPVVDDYSKDRTGSRFMKGGSMREQPLYRRILSGGGTLLSNLVLGTRLKDMTSGFEAFQREILENMNLEKFLSTGHMYQTEMRYYCRNCRTVEVPIHYVGTASSLKGSSVVEALKILFKLKKNERNIWKK